MDQRSIQEAANRLAVNHNGLMIPASLIEDFLTQYCTSLGVVTKNEEYPIYIPGSASLLKYKGRYFMICTRHQLKQTENLEDVCLLIPSEGQTICLTSGGARWFDEVGAGDHQQIVIFDFTEPCLENPEIEPMFFDFRQQHPDVPADDVVAFITYGYPTFYANFDYESAKIERVKMRILSKFHAPGTDDALHIIEPLAPLNFNPDGMSGGPTFCLILDPNEGISVHLAGITVRGGRTKLMAIKAGAVQAMLDTVIQRGS